MIKRRKNYLKIRPIRLSDETWELLKQHKTEQTWNKTIKELLLKLKNYENIL